MYLLQYWDDSTNHDQSFAARNLVRLSILPLLASVNAKAVQHIALASELLEADDELLRSLAQQQLQLAEVRYELRPLQASRSLQETAADSIAASGSFGVAAQQAAFHAFEEAVMVTRMMAAHSALDIQFLKRCPAALGSRVVRTWLQRQLQFVPTYLMVQEVLGLLQPGKCTGDGTGSLRNGYCVMRHRTRANRHLLVLLKASDAGLLHAGQLGVFCCKGSSMTRTRASAVQQRALLQLFEKLKAQPREHPQQEQCWQQVSVLHGRLQTAQRQWLPVWAEASQARSTAEACAEQAQQLQSPKHQNHLQLQLPQQVAQWQQQQQQLVPLCQQQVSQLLGTEGYSCTVTTGGNSSQQAEQQEFVTARPATRQQWRQQLRTQQQQEEAADKMAQTGAAQQCEGLAGAVSQQGQQQQCQQRAEETQLQPRRRRKGIQLRLRPEIAEMVRTSC